MNNRLGVVALVLWSVTACAGDPDVVDTEHGRVRVATVASGLENPWGLAFLPGGDMLVTERAGRLRRVAPDGKLSEPLGGLPPIYVANQGGLLDVALDPAFEQNRLVYLSYSEPREGKSNGTAVLRGRLGERGLDAVEVIFRQLPAAESRGHYGSRLVFARDGRLFITLGERQLKQYSVEAQNLGTHFGKVVRIERDGRVPADNPFVGRPGARPEIWSYGHRNPQGAALHPETGELWITEHGPKGGDELNVVRAGRNYGWPVITYGIDYSGEKVGEGTAKAGMEQPVHYWVPSIGTSGLAFYTADRLPGWQGSVLAGGLSGTTLVRLELAGERVTHEERLLTGLGQRIRDVRQGPDGNVYLLTDAADGRILRLEPADR